MHDLICNSLICKCIHMLVTKVKMQSSPYGDSVISARTEHLKIKGEEKKRNKNFPQSLVALRGRPVAEKCYMVPGG